jgi:hydrogenase nickel incorporation protein HypA/HybF
MHELTIARHLVDLACEHAREQGADRVKGLQVRLGVLSGMLKPLYFCFDAAARGTMCEGAVLEIDEVPLTVMCPRCATPKTPRTHHIFRCPTCGSPTPRVVTGREMQLVALELESFAGEPRETEPKKRKPGKTAPKSSLPIARRGRGGESDRNRQEKR